MDCLLRTVRSKGFLGLYQGATPWFVFAGPRSALRFATFEAARDHFGTFACGTIAGVVEALFTQTPMQAIQIKLVHDASPAVVHKRFAGMGFLAACREILRTDGFLRGFFCGVAPAVAKGAVTNGVRFFGYHGIVSRFATDGKPPLPSRWPRAASPAPSPPVVSQPIDTVKANMMGLDAARYSSSFHCARAIVRSDGILALWNGVGPRTGRVFVEVGLQFTLFEQIFALVDRLFLS